ncbi:MAG: hypothetical protein OXI43_12230 [Candidatus Poribacteria bacterium]|nr:hypothetical protein [Candidatus Poribacteria bacterium]
MSIDNDRLRLSHRGNLENLRKPPGLTEMIPVYLTNEKTDFHAHYILCALVPSNQIEEVLSRSDRNWEYCKGTPTGVVYSTDNEERREYLRYGTDTGAEPLIIERNFYDIRPDYREISEEFRHFHNLYHNRKIELSEYIKIEDDGNEYPVAIVEPHQIQIRLKEILQFAAIKEMHLAIYFDYREYSVYPEEELGLSTNSGTDNLMREGLMCWEQYYTGPISGSSGSPLSVRRLIGKHLVKPLPKSKSGFWPFAKKPKEKYVEFIIDVDENGDDITYTSDPDELKTPADPENIRGVDSNAPSYLTPVHFRKQVLDKYIQASSKYDVEDSVLRCGRLWCMFIDNDHENRVCAWLGDLGRDMPYSEQQHWRVHNIPPAGGISATYLHRQIFAQFTNSNQPEHVFRQCYRNLQKACEENLGWQFLLPLNTADEHHLQSLRVPATDEQRDFDELVLSLTKILIDSLNEKSLKKLVSSENQEELKDKEGNNKRGIAILEVVFRLKEIENADDHLFFLQKLQSLRSSGSAHRKGKNYAKIADYFGIESHNLRDVFARILNRASEVLDYFIAIVKSGELDT